MAEVRVVLPEGGGVSATVRGSCEADGAADIDGADVDAVHSASAAHVVRAECLTVQADVAGSVAAAV